MWAEIPFGPFLLFNKNANIIVLMRPAPEKTLGEERRCLTVDFMIEKRRWKDIQPIDSKLWSAIQPLRVRSPFEHSPGFWKDVYLASAILANKVSFPCVVFVEKDSHDQQQLFPRHGFIRAAYKFDDEKMIDASFVVSVSASPYVGSSMDIMRKLDEHGHFDDYIYHAKLKLKDGKEYWIRKNGFFTAVPDGYTASDIVDVEWPGRDYDKRAIDTMCIDAPMYMLCIFQRPEGEEEKKGV